MKPARSYLLPCTLSSAFFLLFFSSLSPSLRHTYTHINSSLYCDDILALHKHTEARSHKHGPRSLIQSLAMIYSPARRTNTSGVSSFLWALHFSRLHSPVHLHRIDAGGRRTLTFLHRFGATAPESLPLFIFGDNDNASGRGGPTHRSLLLPQQWERGAQRWPLRRDAAWDRPRVWV